MAWHGSGSLADAMSPAPCGCDLIEKAKDEKDPRAAKVLDADGQRLQQQWRCPQVCKATEEALPAPCAKAIANVHRLVGVDPTAGDPPEFTVCPCYYARLPEAIQVSRLLRLTRQGQLSLRVPNPSGAILDAIDLVEDSLALREADEFRRSRERAEGEPKR